MVIRRWIRSIFKETRRRTPDLRPSFSLYHNGGEVWISCIDNLGTDLELVKEKVNNNEELLMRPNKVYRVLFHIDGTEITHEIADYIINSLSRSQNHIFKLTMVGATKSGRAKLKKCQTNKELKLGIKYFSNMDHAKDWLIDEKFNLGS